MRFLEAFRFPEHRSREALVWRNHSYSYQDLLDRIERNDREHPLPPGTVAAVRGEFGPESLALLFSLIGQGCIVVPLTDAVGEQETQFLRLSQAEWLFVDEGGERPSRRQLAGRSGNPLYDQIRSSGNPGLVLFSSGTSGNPKAAVHDCTRLFRKFLHSRHDFRTLVFLLFDHIGGLDTAFYALSNGSCLIVPEDRTPDGICRAVGQHRVEVLPVSPSFLNMLALSGVHEKYDMSSLRFVTYGGEVMPQATLEWAAKAFPNAVLQQKYGTTEVGALRSKSMDNSSRWVKLGGEGYGVRVRNGLLEIKSDTAFLGYLNAPSPFSEDGWFMTGDAVEVDGEWIRILGRASDLINVGGQKVFPAEVEEVIRGLENIADVRVFGEPNVLCGNIVCAEVRLVADEEISKLRSRVRAACLRRLAPHKVPVRIGVSNAQFQNARLKTLRRPDPLHPAPESPDSVAHGSAI